MSWREGAEGMAIALLESCQAEFFHMYGSDCILNLLSANNDGEASRGKRVEMLFVNQ